ncbi:hypothetical protein [Sphingomonas psychrotolerans]|uniref:Uncharacterized protein n=1 Tax=Sphingomonas psychrotolerans TaxID=1327635 RepID=A0A2K8MIU6_9SPHN|nr:hypothetical protein [Sphingomonas psychrotolerans]ATY33795.1 hypothetical protein CVN68_19040 [Sphingomonas psychrotolerans]
MSDVTDNEVASAANPARPDPHGEAALLLVESLIHGLLMRSVLSVGEAVDIVRTAVEVQNDISDQRDDDPGDNPAHRLLSVIATTLGIDVLQEVDGNPGAGGTFNGGTSNGGIR